MPPDADVLAAFDAARVETYRRAACAVFRKTKERFGEFSNMAAGFPLRVNGVAILTAEALYQACRFPHLPEVQQKILDQSSPMTAKMVAKPFRKQARPDFDALRVPIMWWCLRVKLACHLRNFTRHLLFTRDRPIVEDSARDAFWGAKAVQGNAELLRGQNVLGRMLVLLRELLRQHGEEALARIEPPPIPDFLLLGRAIGVEEGRV